MDDGDPTARPRPSNRYVGIVAVEVAFLLWLGWRRGQLFAFAFLALMGTLALYGASYAAASSARMARWMRTRGREEWREQPPPHENEDGA